MSRKGENIYKRKDGRWEGRYIKGYDNQENPITGYVYAKTYSEIREKLTHLKANTNNQKTVISSALTVSEWVQRWILKKGLIKDSTRMVYKSYLKNHIKPTIGSVKLKNLSRDMLQKFINDMAAAFDAQTVRAVFSMLKLALSDASENNLIGTIYLNLKLPKVKIKDVPVLDKPQQKALENAIAARNDGNDIGILICLYSGIRIGELCALKWENVNLDTGIISICETLQRIESTDDKSKTKINFSSPKSLSSVRDIPIPKFLIKKLKAIKQPDGYVINRNGKFIEPRTYTRRFKKLLGLANVPDIKYHSLRHTFATRCLEKEICQG